MELSFGQPLIQVFQSAFQLAITIFSTQFDAAVVQAQMRVIQELFNQNCFPDEIVVKKVGKYDSLRSMGPQVEQAATIKYADFSNVYMPHSAIVTSDQRHFVANLMRTLGEPVDSLTGMHGPSIYLNLAVVSTKNDSIQELKHVLLTKFRSSLDAGVDKQTIFSNHIQDIRSFVQKLLHKNNIQIQSISTSDDKQSFKMVLNTKNGSIDCTVNSDYFTSAMTEIEMVRRLQHYTIQDIQLLRLFHAFKIPSGSLGEFYMNNDPAQLKYTMAGSSNEDNVLKFHDHTKGNPRIDFRELELDKVVLQRGQEYSLNIDYLKTQLGLSSPGTSSVCLPFSGSNPVMLSF